MTSLPDPTSDAAWAALHVLIAWPLWAAIAITVSTGAFYRGWSDFETRRREKVLHDRYHAGMFAAFASLCSFCRREQRDVP